MRETIVVSLVFAVIGVAGAPAIAASPSPWRWTPEAIVDTVAVTGVTISPDGSSVAFTRSRWRTDDAKPGPAWASLWRVPFGGGEAQRLTTADAEDTRPRWSPEGGRLAFMSKRGTGDAARTRVYILPLAGGEAAPLTDEKAEITAFEWSPDGKSIACLAVDRKSESREREEKAGNDARVADQNLLPRRLWIWDVLTGKGEKLDSLGDLSAWEFDWAPDSTALVATVTDLNRTDDAYLKKRIAILPRAGARRELVPEVGKIAEVAWSRDGKTIAWLSGVDASDPWTGSLFVVPASGGAPRNLTGAREESSTSISWRADGKINVTSARGTRSVVSIVDPVAGAWQDVVGAGVAAFSSSTWSADGSRFALAAATAASPTDVWSGSLRPAASPHPIARSNPQLDPLPVGAQETIRYRAKDGVEIEAVLIRPVAFVDGRRYPLVVIAHGGPESYYLDAWQNAWSHPGQALAERGYLVLFPNYRGSTGRGVAFAKSDQRDLGGVEFTDVLDGVDFLASKGWADPKRVGITGGSYGGYFTALGVTRWSDRFAAGVDMFGITSWESYLGVSDIPVENSSVHWDLWCYENAALCRERSPLGNLDRAATPTLILQGTDDERVPKSQSDELYAALRWKKVPVEYVAYPREGHGFRERWHRLDAVTRLMAWMDRYVAGGEAR
ncbi:MAG: S9 family peptidase [Acidobacteria bacterium]|nr:S9 family peptidase [Acidobacteriota bacterium]